MTRASPLFGAAIFVIIFTYPFVKTEHTFMLVLSAILGSIVGALTSLFISTIFISISLSFKKPSNN